MVKRVRQWLKEGRDVRIFTARAYPDGVRNMDEVLGAIAEWCQEHLGRILPITCAKDPNCITIYDDRAIQVEPNTGRLIGESDA